MTPAFSFGLPFIFVPLMIIAWIYGGWTILAVPIFGYVIITIFDFLIGTKLIAPKFKPDEDNKKYKIMYLYCGNNKTTPIQDLLKGERSKSYAYDKELFVPSINIENAYMCYLPVSEIDSDFVGPNAGIPKILFTFLLSLTRSESSSGSNEK